MIIGLAGVARSGKDSFFNFCKDLNLGGNTSEKIAFAWCLKEELEDFLVEKFNINPFTEDKEQKEIIRPILVAYGMTKRHVTKGRYWIDKAFDKIKNQEAANFFITDVRFPNEVDRIKESNGICIHIKRKGVNPVNSEEEYYDPIVRDKSDYRFEWPTFDDLKQPIAKDMVIKFIKKTYDNERKRTGLHI